MIFWGFSKRRRKFSPKSMPGLVCWLNPSVASSLTLSGSNVVQIADLSGNGNSAIQATGAAQPTIATSAFGSKSGLLFDGADDYMNLPSGLYSISQGPWTAIMVHKPLSTGRSERLYVSVSAGTFIHGIASNTSSCLARQTSSGTATATRTKTTNTAIITGVREGANISCYFDGATASGLSTSAANNTLAELMLSHSVTTYGIYGYMGEFLIYNRALSTAELNAVGNYLKTEWGGTWANI